MTGIHTFREIYWMVGTFGEDNKNCTTLGEWERPMEKKEKKKKKKRKEQR